MSRRTTSSRPDDPEGRQGPALLPDRHDLRAGDAQARAGGLRLRRRAPLRGVDDPKDVTRDADGTWHIKAGARVRVQADDGQREPALSRRARRSDARGPRGDEPGARGDRPDSAGSEGADRRAARTGGGTAPGTSTRTCATSASRRSRRCCGKACTSTTTSRARRRPATSSCRRRRPKRCTCPRRSGAAAVIA